MNILAIDTSSQAGSCAYMEDGKLIGEFFANTGHTHSQTALPMVEKLLDICNKTIEQVDVFAVSQGPGSFTGLRIGLAMVKGFAFVNDKPVVPLSTLVGLAYNFMGSSCLIVPTLDARRSQVYTAAFTFTRDTLCRVLEDQVITIDELGNKLETLSPIQPILLVGDGANLCYDKLQEKLPQLTVAPAHLLHQRASSLCMAALPHVAAGEFVPASQLTPTYLRISQAERERLEREEQK